MKKNIWFFLLILLFSFNSIAFASTKIYDSKDLLKSYLYNINDSKTTKIEKVKENINEFIKTQQLTYTEGYVDNIDVYKKIILIQNAFKFNMLYNIKMSPLTFQFYTNEYYDVITTAFTEYEATHPISEREIAIYLQLKNTYINYANQLKTQAAQKIEYQKKLSKALVDIKNNYKQNLYNYYKYNVGISIRF